MTAPLPPQGPQEPDEHLPGETELAALYRQLPPSEPAAALDAAVLQAAASAVAADEQHPAPVIERRRSSREPGDWVHPKPVPAAGPNLADPSTVSRGRRKAGPRWLIALSSAATLVLAAGLAWHMRGMPSTTATPDAAAVSSPAAPPPPAAPAPMVAAQAVAEGNASAAPMAAAHQAAAPMPMPAPVPPARLEMSASAVAPAPFPAAPAPAMQTIEKPTAANPGDTPAQELGKIRQLFAQRHDNEARRRLDAFHHAHPQWELPAELDAQLHKP